MKKKVNIMTRTLNICIPSLKLKKQTKVNVFMFFRPSESFVQNVLLYSYNTLISKTEL